MPKKDYTPIKSVALRGGIDTRREPAVLPFGAFSQVQNLRPRRPGFVKRPGQSKLHTTADSTNGVITIYQFKKQKVTEQHFYAQMTDDDVLEATNNPPTVTTGAFGTAAFAGSSSSWPASYGVIQDQLMFANHVDKAQIYGGTSSYVLRAVVYKSDTTANDIPQEGEDYSEKVNFDDTAQLMTISGMGTDADNYVAFCTPVPIVSLTLDIVTANTTTTTLANVEYRKNDNTWANVSGLSDGTETGGDTTLGQDGTISWTAPTDQVDNYMYGTNGYWYRLKFTAGNGDLSSTTINKVTWSSNWQDIINKWDGVTQDPVEVWVEMQASSAWDKYSAAAVTVGDLPASRKILLFCTDPIQGIYVDVGQTANTAAAKITSIKYWDGDSFESVGTFTDETLNGGADTSFNNSGWITFPRKTAYPLQYESSIFYSYVYEITMTALALDSELVFGFEVMPYFDISELGNAVACAAWRDRNVVNFSKFPQYAYISAEGDPQVLNGFNFGVIEAGDGRTNKILCYRKFHNEMFAWQEEKGIEGGTTTLFQGFSPDTFGKRVISSKIGIMNSKCAEVVDGVLVSTATDERIKTLAFWLSRYGVMASDGLSITAISDEIQNFFDPTDSNSIRLGYEDKNFLKYDSAYNLLRIGLVTGSSATVPNTFLDYDLTDRVWYTDTLGQELLCVEEVEAASGDIITLQVGGGTDDGFIYLLNSGQNDVDIAVNSSITLELDGQGEVLNLEEMIVRCKGQAAGDITLNIEANSINKVTDKTLSMIVEVTNQGDRRHRFHLNVVDAHISLILSHNTVDQDMYLYSIGALTTLWKRR